MVPALYALVNPRDMHRAEQFFDRYGSITVFIGRLLPVVRTFIAFPAWLARMPMAKFQIYTFVGSWLSTRPGGMNILDPAIQRA
jgi:membrane protein DedA with SNARE-associated domain